MDLGFHFLGAQLLSKKNKYVCSSVCISIAYSSDIEYAKNYHKNRLYLALFIELLTNTLSIIEHCYLLYYSLLFFDALLLLDRIDIVSF